MHSSDDEWIMVEDEFLSIAQLYTRSVHRQEYQRLQLEAASKNAGQISNIQRPVVGKPALSKKTSLERKVVAKNELQKRTLSRPALDDSSGDEGGTGLKIDRRGSDLMTLMRGYTGSQTSLSMLIPQKTVATRAAAGYTDSQVFSQRKHLVPVQNQQNTKPPAPSKPSMMVRKPVSATSASVTSSDDDGDLDAPVVKHRKQSMNRSRQPASATAPARQSTIRPVKMEFQLDSDDDLDAPVAEQRKRFMTPPRQSASIQPPTSTRPPVRPAEPERSAVPTARRPSNTELLLDSDDGIALMPTKPLNSRFKGRSMAARERATKDAS